MTACQRRAKISRSNANGWLFRPPKLPSRGHGAHQVSIWNLQHHARNCWNPSTYLIEISSIQLALGALMQKSATGRAFGEDYRHVRRFSGTAPICAAGNSSYPFGHSGDRCLDLYAPGKADFWLVEFPAFTQRQLSCSQRDRR